MKQPTPSPDEFLERLGSHRNVLYKVANAYCRAEADRDDLVSEMVAHLWRSYGRYDDRYAFSTWAYRIALNVAISFYRKHRRELPFATDWDDAAERIAAPGADEQLELLLSFIHQLEPIDRALMLAYLDGYAHAEIASMLGLSQTNVATKISRLTGRLREMNQRFQQQEKR